jgi:hypothetical protein
MVSPFLGLLNILLYRRLHYEEAMVERECSLPNLPSKLHGQQW